VEFSTIVRSRKKGYELPLSKELVSILYHLVGTTDQVKVMFVQKLRHDVFPEGERDSPFIFTPANNSPCRIRPEEVTQ
jgi:hypothetical protein